MISIVAIKQLYFYSILLVYLLTVKWLQVLQFDINYCIQHYSFICTVKWFQVLLYNTNNSSFKYYNLTLIILFKIAHSFIYI